MRPGVMWCGSAQTRGRDVERCTHSATAFLVRSRDTAASKVPARKYSRGNHASETTATNVPPVPTAHRPMDEEQRSGVWPEGAGSPAPCLLAEFSPKASLGLRTVERLPSDCKCRR